MMIQPYDVILADPPWSYRDKNTGGSMTSGSQTKYKTMALEEITAMAPLIDRAMAPDSTLFLWGTVPMLPEALYVLGEWGYDYKTKIEWIKGELGDDGQIKGRLGLGHYFRGVTEEVLCGVRGGYSPYKCQRRNAVIAPATTHSRKPDEMYELIEAATQGKRRLELFATEKREGWDSYGEGIDGRTIQESLADIKLTWGDFVYTTEKPKDRK